MDLRKGSVHSWTFILTELKLDLLPWNWLVMGVD